MGPEDDHDGPSTGVEGGGGGADDERLPVEDQELFRRPHARGGSGCEDDGPEAKGGRGDVSHGWGGCVRGGGGRRGG